MSQYTVALIEDDAFVAEMVNDVLEKARYRVVKATNGAEGLILIKEHTPDIIVCDRNMPEMSGFEMLQLIRTELKEFDKIPFIFLTGLNDPRDKRAAEGLRPTKYLTKPIDVDSLLEAVQSALQSAAA